MQQKNTLAVLVLFDFQLQTAVGISIICSLTQALHLKFSFFHLISFNSQHKFCSDLLQSKTRVVVFFVFFYQETTAPCAGRELRYKTKIIIISAGRPVDGGVRKREASWRLYLSQCCSLLRRPSCHRSPAVPRRSLWSASCRGWWSAPWWSLRTWSWGAWRPWAWWEGLQLWRLNREILCVSLGASRHLTAARSCSTLENWTHMSELWTELLEWRLKKIPVHQRYFKIISSACNWWHWYNL